MPRPAKISGAARNESFIFGVCLPDILCLLTLALCAFKLLYKIDTIYDLNSNDEGSYLYDAILSISNRDTSLNYSPLYTIWYELLLNIVRGNAERAYYLNYQLISFLLPLTFYISLRANLVRPLLALIAAWMILVSTFNLSELKVASLACCLFFVGLSIAPASASKWTKCIVVAAFAWLASYIRPEFRYVAGIVLAGGFFWVRDGRWWLSRRDLALLIGAAAIVIGSLLGFAHMTQDPNRLFFAFAQHFADWWAKRTHADYDGFTHTYEIARQVFGPTNSILGAIQAAPELVFRHILANIAMLPLRLIQGVIGHVCLFTPANSFNNCRVESAVTPVVALALLAATLGWRAIVAFLKDLVRIDRFNGLIILSSALFLVSAVMIYPRQHYLQFIVLTIGYGVLIHLNRYIDGTNPIFTQNRSLAGLLLIALVGTTPYLGQNGYLWYDDAHNTIADPARLPLQTAVAAIRAHVPDTGTFRLGTDFVTIVDYVPSVIAIAPDHIVEDLSKGTLDGVLLDDALRRDGFLARDANWAKLLTAPDALGFDVITLASGDQLLLRAKLGH